jgi:tRNA threonylcarbamoyladenosine biosynthesis protein TsaB
LEEIFLGISTIEKETGISFIAENKVLHELIVETEARHNETLFTFLDDGFKTLKISPQNLRGIGVVLGPGMFTSLRIGLACAKGLAVTTNIPIKGFPTLDALVFSLPKDLLDEKRTIIPVLDIRRDEIYYRIYQGLNSISEPIITKPEVFAKNIPEDAILFGSGINRYKDLIKSESNMNFTVHQLTYPKPSAIAFRARECIMKNDISNIETLVPFYIR